MLPAGVLTETKVGVDGRFISLKSLINQKRNRARRKERKKDGRKRKGKEGVPLHTHLIIHLFAPNVVAVENFHVPFQ